MDKQILKAQKRKIFGRRVKSLRNQGLLPANIYGKKIKSEAVQVVNADFLKAYEEAGETVLIELRLNGDSNQAVKKMVLIHNVQVDPVSDSPVHADFLQVNLKEKVTASVPIEVVGESPAEKVGKGTAVQQIDEVEVEALPTDLPEKFVVDISGLTEVDQAILIKDLNVDTKKVDVKLDREQIVVKVEELRKEEEVAAAPEVPIEGEVPSEGQVDVVVSEGEDQAPVEKGQGEEKKVRN